MSPPKRNPDVTTPTRTLTRPAARRKVHGDRHVYVFLILIVFFVTGFIATLLIGLTSLRLPDVSSVAKYQPAQATLIYDRNGALIDRMYVENRTVVPLSEMNPLLPHAFVAAEDGRFYDHLGLDPFSVLRALINNIKDGERGQGGSTITQQVAKSLLLTPEKTYIRKIREAILAWRIDKLLSKDEILFIYLNQIYLGEGAHGVEAAAQTYFGKPCKELSLAEVSLLAGLPQAPSKYSPMRHLDQAVARQKYVLNRMAADGYIDQTQARSAFDQRLVLKKTSSPKREEYGYYLDTVKKEARALLGVDLQHAGAKIHTNLDPVLQKRASSIMAKGLGDITKNKKFPLVSLGLHPQGALVCIEHKSGKVRALVGGGNYGDSPFNRAVQAKRPVGSTFKPFLYAAALSQGWTPHSIISDAPFSLSGKDRKMWTPHNYTGKYHGEVSLTEALSHSYNVASVRLMQKIGYVKLHNLVRSAGITESLQKDLSLALGAIDLSLLDMTAAYMSFARQGTYMPPSLIESIVTADNRQIMLGSTSSRRVYPESVAAGMESMLHAVVFDGSGKKAAQVAGIRGGKTGTSNENRDAWFIGFTDEYTAGVWVGDDKNQSLGKQATGGSIAAPIWASFMEK